MKTYTGMPHLYGNVLAAIDFETTGNEPGYHEIIQVAVVPLDSQLNPHPDMRPFYSNVAPEYPERAEKEAEETHNLDLNKLILEAPSKDRVAQMLHEWFVKLDLPISKRLVPLAQNWSFESGFLNEWLGIHLKEEIFHHAVRDPMINASFWNDRMVFHGEKHPFNRIGLLSLCNILGVTNENPHDALSDAIATAHVYRAMLLKEF